MLCSARVPSKTQGDSVKMEITLATNIKVGTRCMEIILSQDIMEKETGNVKCQDQ